MSSIIISKSGEKDLEIVQNLGIQTFTETFAEDNTEESMKKYLDESFNTEKIKSELNSPDSFFILPGKRIIL